VLFNGVLIQGNDILTYDADGDDGTTPWRQTFRSVVMIVRSTNQRSRQERAFPLKNETGCRLGPRMP
jgi:hypothetical protein